MPRKGASCTSVDAEDLVIDDSGEGEAIKRLVALLRLKRERRNEGISET
jgi:hypothetical protein